MEQWGPIENFPNYIVSDEGRVKNRKRNRVLKPCSDKDGYPQVALSNNGHSKTYKVHRLVGEVFVEGRSEGLEINHKNGNKQDNRAVNLEWVSGSENTKHAYALGLAHRSPMAGSAPVCIRVVETDQLFGSQSECAKVLGIKREGVNACINGRLETYYGLHFERVI